MNWKQINRLNRYKEQLVFVRMIKTNTQGEWNHYQTLGIKMDAKPEEIKAAYIKLSKLHHPDKSSNKTSEEFIKARSFH